MYNPAIMMNYAGELTKLRQGGNYDDYQREFTRLSHHIRDLLEKFLVNCFVNGLRDTTKYEVMADADPP